jgi:hypothetical protein
MKKPNRTVYSLDLVLRTTKAQAMDDKTHP